MRICLYTATAHPKLGGQEAVVDALARHLTLAGHRAVVLAPRPRLPLRPRDADLPYPVYRHPRFYSTRRFISLYARFIANLHAKERFDVVHCHDVYPTGYLAALCRARVPVPLVITSHGGDVKEGNVRISKPGMLARYVRAVEAADALISIGPFTSEGFARLHRGKAPIVHIPNGIDLAPLTAPAPRPPDLPATIAENRYVLYLGRLHHRKGVDVLLEAFAQLRGAFTVRREAERESDQPAGEPRDLSLVIAGSGDERSALEHRARELGVADRVQFVGRVEGSRKAWLLQNALCVAMPSRVWEAFPLVLMESYAAGKPVIGSRVPGIQDLIDDGRTGLLVPQESAAELARSIKILLNDPAIADRMGAAAKEVAQRYSWESVTRQHIELYERVCGERLATNQHE